MIDIAHVRSLAELDECARAWDHLASETTRFHPRYSNAREELKDSSFLALACAQNGQITGLACFINRLAEERFNAGERRLFSLHAQETVLFGGNVLGKFSRHELTQCLSAGFREWHCDLFDLGEAPVGSELHIASKQLPFALLRTRRQRKDPVRWSIRLPHSFEDYLAQLRSSTRKSARYTLRRFQRELPYRHELICEPEQIEFFLRAAESISRRTYQWHVGQRVQNDEATRTRYLRLAQERQLRCHLLFVNDEPCAFTRGQISGSVYHYETPGFLTNLSHYSPGIVLLLWTIRDIIENTSCSLFDFGSGGDDRGYKARFGTSRSHCKDLHYAPVWRPYSALLFTSHLGLATIKDIGQGLGGYRVGGHLRRAVTETLP